MTIEKIYWDSDAFPKARRSSWFWDWMKAGMRARLFAPWSKPASAELLMPDEPEHKRVHTVLDDAQIAADVRVDPMFAKDARPIRWKIDTDPKCKGPGGKPIRIRGMIEDGKLYKPGETPDEN